MNKPRIPPESQRKCDNCNKITTWRYNPGTGHSQCTICGWARWPIPISKLVVCTKCGGNNIYKIGPLTLEKYGLVRVYYCRDCKEEFVVQAIQQEDNGKSKARRRS